MLRCRSASERYFGCTTDNCSTSGSRLDCHVFCACVTVCAPRVEISVLRTSCMIHWPLCWVAVFAHWNEVSSPASLKPNTRTSASSTAGRPFTTCASAALALMMASPSLAHRPLRWVMPSLPEFSASWMFCARCSPTGAAVSPRMNTPTISTATVPAADQRGEHEPVVDPARHRQQDVGDGLPERVAVVADIADLARELLEGVEPD